jgi:hypothetical protein
MFCVGSRVYMRQNRDALCGPAHVFTGTNQDEICDCTCLHDKKREVPYACYYRERENLVGLVCFTWSKS